MATGTAAQLQCTKQGGPFEVVNVPKPTLSPNDVLIRQRVIAFNPVDVKQRDYGIGVPKWPHVLGIEGAGIVEAVGSEVRGLLVGDEVAAFEGGGASEKTWGGAYQELVAVPQHVVFKKPENISLLEAASLPTSYMTAVCAIVEALEIPLAFFTDFKTTGSVPSSVLVLGGSSASGAAAIQLLRKAYPQLPILTTASAKHHERLRGLGATDLIDYKSSSVVESLRAASPNGAGVDVIIDCVSSGATQTDISDAFDPSGSKRYAALATGTEVVVPQGVTKIDIFAYSVLDIEGGKQLLPSLTNLFENGTCYPPLPVRVVGHGLEQVPTAMDSSMTTSGDKVVLTL